jgi:hypothetical protein
MVIVRGAREIAAIIAACQVQDNDRAISETPPQLGLEPGVPEGGCADLSRGPLST